tara:strand:+ start:284 stop:673 length:390 start_codon:yes stop_codon:yes gene_type:complete
MGNNGKKADLEKRKQYLIEYRIRNKEKRAQYNAEFIKTSIGIKCRMISSWKSQGLKLQEDQTYDMIYERYLNSEKCECCLKPYLEFKGKHMDHCHTTGKFRNVLCRSCNQLRGHIDKDYKLILKLLTLS